MAAAGWLLATGGSAPAQAPATVFEGARLITGESDPPIENSAFVIESGRITAVGRRGEVPVPAGAARVDLAGKTVIPALTDAHSHIGYMRRLSSGPQNYTRENILDHMYKFAYFGVAASMAMGSDFGDMPMPCATDPGGKVPGAARFLTAGRGLARSTRSSRTNAPLGLSREQGRMRGGRAEAAAHGVTMVKTWVDSRGGSVRKLTPPLFTAIIDEAHKRNMRVVVHATGLADVKALLRANVDGLAHMVNDVDDELVDLLKARPNTFFTLALGGLRRSLYAPWLNPPHVLVSETVWPDQIKRLQDRLGKGPGANAQQNWDRIAKGVARFAAVGVRIGVGTDGGGQQGDQFIGWTMHTELENMVAAGMTPAQVMVAATKTSAGILKLDQLGTVAAGKSADFVVLDANPLDNILNTRKINKVYQRGTTIDRALLSKGFTTEAN